MTKSSLIKRLSRQFPGISVIEAKEMIDLFLAAMKDGLNSDDTIEH
jgi:nucleoid DNA-binding protein